MEAYRVFLDEHNDRKPERRWGAISTTHGY